MRYIQDEGRIQRAWFHVVLEGFIQVCHVCRVMDYLALPRLKKPGSYIKPSE
jgi:hypothetical protein